MIEAGKPNCMLLCENYPNNINTSITYISATEIQLEY